jgi:glycerophosphoryl diester phosphodiesterase
MGRWNTLHGLPPRIIAHRGASGYRPEHTLAGYALAMAQGADVLEPDLVLSRDGVLFARHDLGLSLSTDIARRAEFTGRGREIAGVRDWWVSDFDAHELDALRAVQPFRERGTQYDGQFGVPRFGALLDLAKTAADAQQRPIVVDAELKDPEFFRARGLDLAATFVAELEQHGLTGAQAPVWVECFDHAVLREVHARCGNPCFALCENAPGESQLRELAAWVRGVAPSKYLLWDNAARDTGLVAAAHRHGLEVHAWTFRADRTPAPFATAREELEAAFALGVDAMFCDFPDIAVAARAAFGG